MIKARWIVLTTITLALSTSALAARDGGKQRFHDRGNTPALEVIEHVKRALHRLDLREEQKAAIREDLHGMRDTLKPLVKELAANRKAIREQTFAADYDAQSIEGLAENQGALTAEITMMVSGAVNTVLDHLDEDQRATLEDMAAERQALRQEVREGVRARRDLKRSRKDAGDGDDS